MKLSKLLCAFMASLSLLVAVAPAARAADNVIRVGTDATFPPMEFVKDGKRTGFDVELMEALAKTMGKKIQWVDIDFKGLIPGLISNRFDIAASAIYMTDERRKVVTFSDPYYRGGLAVLVRRDDNSIKVPEDLNRGKRVSVQVGTKSVSYLRDNFPGVERVEVEKNQAMFDLLATGRVNAVVTGRPAAVEYARTQPLVRVLDKGLTTELYGFALRKDDTVLTEHLNKALQTLRINGTYDALTDKWFGKKQ
ncbi:glutamine ABC transporter periplasmic protein [Herbaspirillum sp. GW103]|uniref:glutamine ABC transporter substrate-binding protein n=1 Tax=unclassified Herbaspirillum TaxID=2624150 RepID=UPI00025E502E|nr:MULTISPECIES: glutamine ABC transporter substrate-binding protein [unclassified Herbaspirillum]EIJ47460.1 glutamine ABC transporter periplasmic protein [Herbaspirillum sp. GW103]